MIQISAEQTAPDESVMLTPEEIQERLNGNGWLITPGMNPNDYEAVINEPWKEIELEQGAEPSGIEFTYEKVLIYREWESLLFDLAKHEDVRLFELGETALGRKIYSLEIGTAPNTFLLSGGVHAREIGSVYLLYNMLMEMIQNNEQDAAVHDFLTNNVKFAAMVCVNPDGYDYFVATGRPIKSNNQYKDGSGIDINDSFPASIGGFQIAGTSARTKETPGTEDYSGPTLGEAKETQAMMRFFHKYIAQDKNAVAYIDIHQQGRVVYRSIRTEQVDDTVVNHRYGQKLINYLGYRYAPYGAFIGGSGGTTARMAMDYSLGFQMGRFGVMGLPVDGECLPLALYKDLPGYLDYYPNKTSIPCITLEITAVNHNNGPLRNVKDTQAEYKRFKYSGFLRYAAEAALS